MSHGCGPRNAPPNLPSQPSSVMAADRQRYFEWNTHHCVASKRIFETNNLGLCPLDDDRAARFSIYSSSDLAVLLPHQEVSPRRGRLSGEGVSHDSVLWFERFLVFRANPAPLRSSGNPNDCGRDEGTSEYILRRRILVIIQRSEVSAWNGGEAR